MFAGKELPGASWDCAVALTAASDLGVAGEGTDPPRSPEGPSDSDRFLRWETNSPLEPRTSLASKLVSAISAI